MSERNFKDLNHGDTFEIKYLKEDCVYMKIPRCYRYPKAGDNDGMLNYNAVIIKGEQAGKLVYFPDFTLV